MRPFCTLNRTGYSRQFWGRDPDIEDLADAGLRPTPADIAVVRSFLQFPPELVVLILDLAEYWIYYSGINTRAIGAAKRDSSNLRPLKMENPRTRFVVLL